MNEYNINAVLQGGFDCVPQKATEGSAGYDLVTCEDRVLYSRGLYTFHTGVSFEIPEGMCGLVIARSSLCKKGLKLANSVGLIDSDYRGEIRLLIEYDGINPEAEGVPVRIAKGTRLAQILFLETPNTVVRVVQSLSNTTRGIGGFGSTGGYHSEGELF